MSNKNKLLQTLRVWKKWRPIAFIRHHYIEFLENQRLRMAGTFDGLPQLCLLGIVCGLSAGGVIIVFRLLVEKGISFFTGDANGAGFENLSNLNRFFLVVAGSVLAGVIFSLFSEKNRQVGVAHVLERLTYQQGYLPIKNAIAQFIGATIVLITGQSIGREGPGVHLGATSGSILGRYLKVPYNSTRTLVCCGVAAAIAAGFNTPLAGVIFAMEVVVMEYTIIGFTPVIIAAVTATTLTRIVFGSNPIFDVQPFDLVSLNELPLVALLGIIIGCISAVFTQMTLFMTDTWKGKSIILRMSLAGLIVGAISFFVPQVMGLGYDTVNAALIGQIGLMTLIVIVIGKCIASAVACGLGIPGGLIGPNLVIGACAGGSVALVAQNFFPGIAYEGFYATLGMGAMMGATLQAPLAALIALLELTANHSIILPGMIAIISAVLAERIIFKKPSIYRLLMMARGLDYRNNPMAQALRRTGVASIMERNIVQQGETITLAKAEKILEHQPRWIAVLNKNGQAALIPSNDLINYIQEIKNNFREKTNESTEEDQAINMQAFNIEDTVIDLLTFPAMRQTASKVTTIDTLQEAYKVMQNQDMDIVYVSGAHGRTQNKIYGIVTMEHIERNTKQDY